jgi:hypothetical protein
MWRFAALLGIVLLGGCGEEATAPEELTLPTVIREHPELWPLSVELTETHEARLGRNQHKTYEAGRRLVLVEAYTDTLVLYDPEVDEAFNCPPARTDLLERARAQRAEGAPEAGRVARALRADIRLVGDDDRLTRAPADLLTGKTRIVLFHCDERRADNLSAIREVVKRYPRWKKRFGHFELLYVHHDGSLETLHNLAHHFQPPFPLTAFDAVVERAFLLAHDAYRKPCFIVVDPHGRTKATSVPWNGDPLGWEAAIEMVEAHLEASAPATKPSQN